VGQQYGAVGRMRATLLRVHSDAREEMSHMADDAMLVDEADLIEELLNGMPRDEARRRALCEAVFDSEDVAELQDLAQNAARLRRMQMEDPRPHDGRAVGRLYQYRDDMTVVSAEIYGGPPRMLRLAPTSP